LILLVAAGLAAQMAKFLVQGDWLPPFATPLWDSSSVLPMNSFLGSTLHIMLGYEAQPSGMQVLFYVTTLVVISLGSWWVRSRKDSLSSFKLKSA
jgi:high-affinity iron transporter